LAIPVAYYSWLRWHVKLKYVGICLKVFFCSRIGLLLEHDHPLPKHLLTSSSTGRYSPVLTRKAASKVSELLKNWSEFALLENHTYISFIRGGGGGGAENSSTSGGESEVPPTSFYVVRVTSKPPCLVVWLAFLAGIPGSVRHAIMLELYDRLKLLTVRQRIGWRDIPLAKIRPPAPLASSSRSDLDEEASGGAGGGGEMEDEDSVNLTTKAHPAQPASQFSDVYCCVLLSKPVEKILVRYENMPTDFADPLGPCTKRSSSPPPTLGAADTQQKIQSRNASVAFLTLSRYLNHKRWIWSLQSGPGYTISTAAVGRILNTLCKIRLLEGFTFAHSSKGIQNMVLEVPMIEEEQQQQQAGEAPRVRASPNCVLQYIIFPPHLKSLASSTSDESVSGEEDSSSAAPSKDGESVEAQGEIQIITELWTEPQNGVSALSEPNNSHMSGKTSRDLASVFKPRDLECVSTLITFEHLYMMCDNAMLPLPLSSTPGNLFPPNLTDTDLSVPLPPLTSNSSIEHVPLAFDLLGLLPKSHQTEMLFSLLLQDLGHCLSDSHLSMYPGIKPLADKPNQLLFETLMKELKKISDRELPVPAKDCPELAALIGRRQSADFKFQNNNTTTGQPPQAPSHTPRHSNSFSSHLQQSSRGVGLESGATRRYPSGASVSSSLADTLRDLHSHVDSEVDLFSGSPRWRCFIKAISPTHLIFTLLPATYEDLKRPVLGTFTL
jgi:KICSTOR complex protein SZT2